MKIYILAIAVASLLGCSSTGKVNKETVTKGNELCTYITDVKDLIKVYGTASSSESEGKANVSSSSAPVKVETEGRHSKSEEIVMMAKMIDQVNSQSYPFLYAMTMARNMQPCDAVNTRMYWATLNNLINKAFSSRDKMQKQGFALIRDDSTDVMEMPNDLTDLLDEFEKNNTGAKNYVE